MTRIIIISANSFGPSSNGLTLKNLFNGWNKDNLAQFYIQNEFPDFSFCSNYHNVTDYNALKSIFSGEKFTDHINNISEANIKKSNADNSLLKNPLTMLLRTFIWMTNRWKGKKFNDWLDKFNPDIIFIDIGDNPAQIKLTRDISRKKNIPIVIYNTEAYYFFNENYMLNSPKWTNYFYPIFRSVLHYQFKKIMEESSAIIHGCDKLKILYDKEFTTNSFVIYNSSNIKFPEYKIESSNNLKISYLGNLGLHRPKALVEFADVLKEINSNQKIEIYGSCTNEAEKRLLENHSNIIYNGVVCYDKVLNIINKSDILIHVESSEMPKQQIEYGFSTKIADSLASGRCFFIYAPDYIACYQYLNSNIPEVTASNKEELKYKLNKIISESAFRKQCANKCLQLSEKNHSTEYNKTKLNRIIDDIIRT